jgi:hypothetical protein
MTAHKALPISSAHDVYVQLDRRPLMLHRRGAVRDFGPWRPGMPRMHAGVDEYADADGRFFEVIVHFVSTMRDDRCVVARFRTIQEASAEMEQLAIMWFLNYGGRRAHDSAGGWTPCQN